MIVDGRKIAEEVLSELKVPTGLRLVAVLVGDHAGSKKFLELKQKAAEKLGIEYETFTLPENITTGELVKEVTKISNNSSNHGVLVELPLPGHLDTQKVLNAIPVEKDVDVLSEAAQGLFFSGHSEILPPAVEAVRMILVNHHISLQNKNCVVLGYGLLVGRQISHWLAQQKATVTVVNELTSDQKYFSAQADIIISGVGKPGLITSDMVKEGVVVIDFGYENLDGKMVGDVDFEGVSPKASLITPVPGGVGPLVIAAVLKNLVTLTHV